MGMSGEDVEGGAAPVRVVRPGLLALVAYRVGGRRPTAEHDAWLRRDVGSRWYPLRSAVASTVVIVLLLLAWSPVGQVLGSEPLPLLFLLAVAPAVLVLRLVAETIGHRRTAERLFPTDPRPDHFRPYSTRGLEPPD